jgi:hypothetical protein
MTWRIPYFRHDLGQPELASLAQVLEGEVLTTGEAVSAFEPKFAATWGSLMSSESRAAPAPCRLGRADSRQSVLNMPSTCFSRMSRMHPLIKSSPGTTIFSPGKSRMF